MWGDWRPTDEVVEDVLTAGPARRLAVTLDQPPPAAIRLPPLWHWLYFLAAAARSELGADGHPARGGFLPPVPARRRMFAGGRIRFERPLHFGDPVTRRGTVVKVEEKRGRSGPLVVVTVRYEISGPAGLALVEEQDLVYTDGPPQPRPAGTEPPPKAAAGATITTDEVLLFRFSALTFNGHRIHYDRSYAVDTEGYPGIVVHGPLVAVLLAGLAGGMDGRPMEAFTFRARAPFFVGDDLVVRGDPDQDGAALRAYSADGVLGMEARAEFSSS